MSRPGVDHTCRTGRDTIAPSSSSAPTSIVKPYPRLSSFCPFAVPPVSPSLLCPCNASPLFSMAFVAGAALPMTRQRPARATCTMSAGGGEKKSLGQWVRCPCLEAFFSFLAVDAVKRRGFVAPDCGLRVVPAGIPDTLFSTWCLVWSAEACFTLLTDAPFACFLFCPWMVVWLAGVSFCRFPPFLSCHLVRSGGFVLAAAAGEDQPQRTRASLL